MACALCEKRKEKRYCPAKASYICPQCCGTYREVTIDCPSSCSYLRESRRQAQQRLPRTDLDLPFPQVEIDDSVLDGGRESLVIGIASTVVNFASQRPSLADPDITDTLERLASTLEILQKGLVYESLPTDVLRVELFRRLQAFFDDYRRSEKRMVVNRTRDVDLFKAAVFLLRAARLHSNGRPRSRAFLDVLRSFAGAPQPQQSAIIIP